MELSRMTFVQDKEENHESNVLCPEGDGCTTEIKVNRKID